jgi:hypothetical protein
MKFLKDIELDPLAPATEAEEEAAAALVLALQNRTPMISVTEDPEVDPELIGVVYQLRPDRAPKPRVSIEEILAGVKEGPLSVKEPESTSSRGTPGLRNGQGPVSRPGSSTGTSRTKGALPRWVVPVLGIGATAALAAMIVIPLAGGLAFKNSSEEVVAAAPPASIPEAAPREPELASTAPARAEAPAQPAELAADAIAPNTYKADPEGTVSAGPATTVAQGTKSKEAPLTENDAPRTPEESARKGMPPEPPINPPTSPIASTGGNTELEVDPNEQAMAEALGYLEPEAPKAAAPPIAQTTSVEAGRSAAREEDREDSKPKSRNNTRSAPVAEAVPPAGYSGEDEVADADDALAGAEKKAESSRVIWPLDYNESWYAAYPDVAAVYAKAAEHEGKKEWTQAAMLYRDLMGDARSFVAQDAAYRCARAWWQGGQSGTALKAIEEGLQKSAANTPYRARLYALKGDILSAQGKTQEAEEARSQAAALNEGR